LHLIGTATCIELNNFQDQLETTHESGWSNDYSSSRIYISHVYSINYKIMEY
jgi:hypothetical protein